MKITALFTAAALAASLFTAAAQAQTGRPSTDEAPAAPITQVRTDPQVGSYARYLMLNGMDRDEAVANAYSIDHPGAARAQVARARAAQSATTGAAQ